MTEDTGQISADAAEVYETHVVPAVFAEWAPRVLDAAGVRDGHGVLDVACGTGIVAREALRRVGASGRVIGLDPNPAMLAVARRIEPRIEWREGRAERLELSDTTFDAVTCQFGFMYFSDKDAALREMRRVLRPGGRAALTTWDAIEHQPDRAIVDVLEKRFGADAADELRAPFADGAPAPLRSALLRAGFRDVEVRTVSGTARAPSARAYVEGILTGWTLADRIPKDEMPALIEEATAAIEPHARADGDGVVLPAPAHIVSGTR